ncbi:hypothetical protein D9757_005718 [Collybiopsis confluens]|uniref:CID domain-containing protein n=1 Tax=Collybiopsis confluens TaxID=2823264 RepID=A0A8H5HQ22_9AGAR|nr:hypothetical protein D9757_005718 [Collybiopsis confluens]
MNQIEEFESKLKEVVQAKRLSASKITNLTELAMKLMKNDTQLVSILYRTHKSLSSLAKISSLYVFDALARAAKSHVNKHNLVGDINASEGNCATFLLKMQGVLEGLFKDMNSAVIPGAKRVFQCPNYNIILLMLSFWELDFEKSQKVLDIWVKGNTFPPALLSQLADVLKSKDTVKEISVKPVASSDPRMGVSKTATPTPPPATVTPPLATSSQITTPSPLNNSQSALFAFLAQAAANAGATATSTQASTSVSLAPVPSAPAVPQLDVAQLALLKQLTQTAQISNMYSNTGSALVQSLTSDVNAARASSGNEHASSHLPRFGSPDDENYHGGRGGPRGGSRGAGRERWYEGRGKRGGRDHFRDRDRSDRAKRSRSRSPPSRYGARREIKPYSPPRRPMAAAAVREPLDTGGESQPPSAIADDAEIDEFGRMRPPSEDTKNGIVEPQTNAIQSSQQQQQQQPSSVTTESNALSTTSSGSMLDNTNTSPGLDQFNIASFDFTAPASWEELGKMWLKSYSAVPTTEQLMQFVMLAGTSMDSSQTWSSQDSWGQSGQWDNTGGNSYTDDQMSMEGGRGGEVGYNGGGNSYQGQSTAAANKGADPRLNRASMADPNAVNGQSSSGEKRSGGGMKKVGDKWVFVRDGDDTGVS